MPDYQCPSCKRHFPKDEAERRPETITTEFWGRKETTTIGYAYICPHCFAEDLDEVYMCEDCGELPCIEGLDYCQACEDAYVKLDEELAKPVLTREEKLDTIGKLHATLIDITLSQQVAK